MSEPLNPSGDDEHLARLAAEQASPTIPEAGSAGAPATRRRRGAVGGMLALLGAILAKTKGALLVALAKLKWLVAGAKLLKLGKVVTTGATMAVTIWVYAHSFGFPFAAGFVLLIFVHEMGHALALRAHGIPAGAPVFIPFVGAMIAMKRMPANARVEAEVAIAGPLAGGTAATACWLGGRVLGEPLLIALASTGFVLNLFNLIPVSPLDGGRVAGAISRWFWGIGVAIAMLIALRTSNPLLWAIVLLGTLRALASLRGQAEPVGYFDLSPSERGAIAGGYFLLAGLLAIGSAALARGGS